MHISAGEESSVTFADIDRAMAQALGTEPVGEKYVQVSYDSLVMMRHQFRRIFGPCNERLMLRAIRLYGAFSMLGVRFSNEKLLETGMPKPPRFTEYLGRCVQTTVDCPFPNRWLLISNNVVIVDGAPYVVTSLRLLHPRQVVAIVYGRE